MCLPRTTFFFVRSSLRRTAPLGKSKYNAMNQSLNSTSTPSTSLTPQQAQIMDVLEPLLAPMGYSVVLVEVSTHRQKVLRIFIDHLGSTADHGTIGIEDCVKVTRALEEPLDQVPEIEAIFHGAYELEVSSPGADRPLRTSQDFSRFTGRRIRLHTFRPLTAEEAGNADHIAKNPRQKNFLGVLQGLTDEGKVRLSLQADDGTESGQKKGKKAKAKTPEPASASETAPAVCIPMNLISKANLEPVFEFDDQRSES